MTLHKIVTPTVNCKLVTLIFQYYIAVVDKSYH